MLIEWTVTASAEFDLEQAIEDFYEQMEWYCNKDNYDEVIYNAVEANFDCRYSEYIDTSTAIEQCAQVLRKAIGGVQLTMEDLPTLWQEDSVWKK